MQRLQVTTETSRSLVLIGYRPEESGHLTAGFVVGAQIVLIFTHALFFIFLMNNFNSGQGYISWIWIFWIAWCGDLLGIFLLVLSWFASCSYINTCVSENASRVGQDTNPSVLTDLLPEIVLSIGGFIYVLLILITEILLYKFVSSGFLVSYTPFVLTAVMICLISVTYGVLVHHDNSQVFFVLGTDGLVTLLLSLWVINGLVASVLVLPSGMSAAVLSILEALKLCKVWLVLCQEEKNLRFAASFLYATISISCFAACVNSNDLSDLLILCIGAALIGLSIVKARAAINVFKRGTVQERLHQQFVDQMSACEFCLPGTPSALCPAHGTQHGSRGTSQVVPTRQLRELVVKPADTTPLIVHAGSRNRLQLQRHAGDMNEPDNDGAVNFNVKRSL